MMNSGTPRMSAMPTARRAVTLTEVLMSLMIMSIGVTSVAVLFPISVLRSIQSTQLTNAAILKYNAEALLQQNPKVVFDPDGNYELAVTDLQGQFALAEHYQSAAMRNYIVDPVGYHSLFGFDNNGDSAVDASDDAWARSFGNNGLVPGFQVNSAGVPTAQIVPSLRRFDGRVMASLGGVAEPSVVSSALTANQIYALESLASRLGRLGDGKTDQLDTYAESLLVRIVDGVPYFVGVQLPPEITEDLLTSVPTSSTSNPGSLIPDPEIAEVVLFSQDGRFSQTFPLTGIIAADRKVFWSEFDDDTLGSAPIDFNLNGNFDIRPLPAEFGGAVGRVLLRSVRTADFTWLLTVRRGSDGQARGVDVVIRYHTGVKPEDERVFPATFVQGLSIVGVQRNTDGTEPFLKRGGFIFDALNARWYRITDYEERPPAAFIPASQALFWATYDYRVNIETSAVSSAGTDAVPSGAIFLPGVVDVYPMGSLSLPTAF